MLELSDWFHAHINKTIDVDGMPLKLVEIERTPYGVLTETRFTFMLDEQAYMRRPSADVIDATIVPVAELPEPKPERDYSDARYW
jgi:hypothetical protein